MIPIKLQLKNFLSYGSQPQVINFNHYNLICLSGKNGHGKSALLDAITWSLWGQARKISTTSKPDEGLLRLGEVEMSVTFDFQFGKNKYRVRRDFSKKYGKPHVHVEFGMLQKEDYFVSLTEKTSRKTQEKIEQTIGLDYETFTNSSFLRQGNANEFSKKSPKERKEILCTILGLHQYDKARSSVLEKIRSAQAEKIHLEKLHEHTEQEYDSLKTVPDEQKIMEKELKTIETEQHILHQKQVHLTEHQTQLHQKQQAASLLEAEQKQTKEEEQKQREQLTHLVNQWKTKHQSLLSLPDRKALETQYKDLEKQITELQTQFQKSLSTKELLLEKKEQLSKVTSTLEKEFVMIRQKESLQLERLLAQEKTEQEKLITLKKQIESLDQKTINLKNTIAQTRKVINPELLVSDLSEQMKLFERRKGLYQKWVEQGNWVNNERKELEQKKQLSQDANNPCCPLCEQNLSQARKRFLHKKFLEQADYLNHRFERLKNGIAGLKKYLHLQHEQLQKSALVETLQTELTTIQEQIKNLEKEHKANQETLAATTEKLTTTKKECISLEAEQKKLLKHHPEVEKLETTVQELEKELLANQYNAQKHKEIAEQFDLIKTQLNQCNELESLKAVQKERQHSVHALCCSLKTIQKKEKRIEQDLTNFKTVQTEVTNLKTNLQKLEEQIKILLTHKETVFQKKGHLEAQAQKRAALSELLKKQESQIQTNATALYDLQLIAAALGKDGIQALLIEDALPEIEQEANDLLARLTDNQASITIESLRDLKKGGTRETLDINISDATGIRPYELFSGGEAFRIDFSLRIAISKLLARRAGTSLQTLIIDEGFGSQDEEGLNRMMDALYTIQDDFEKIIIVSHLPAMKEQFPVHFYIQKEPNGSQVTVVEHG